jgi:RecA-family ATPase
MRAPEETMGSKFQDVPNTQETTRKLRGCPLAQLVNKTPNEADTLLCKRYLCRGGGLLVVAPSGHGKSVLSMQAAIQWAIGKPSFGVKPARPLRILIIRAEDDEGDCIEMSQIAKHLEITKDEFTLLERNVWLEPLNDLTGLEFIRAVDGFLDEWPADIVIINPLTAYLGATTRTPRRQPCSCETG